MEKTSEAIIRKSVHTFLQNYHNFACATALLVLPFSASVLFLQVLHPTSSHLIQTIHYRLQSLFHAAGFPPTHFFTLVNLKLSQTIASSIFTLPFTLTFLLIAKASIIHTLHYRPALLPPFSSFSSFIQRHRLYQPVLVTHLCNSFVILSANAAAFSILFLVFNCLDALDLSSPNIVLFLSAAGALLYSIILANTLMVCNMAIIVAGMENCDGFLAILKACVLIRGRTATALTVALPTNLGLAAIEALFQYRVVREYRMSDGKLNPTSAWEAPLIAYMYSLLIILDTVMGCIFFKSCRNSSSHPNQEGRHCYQVELMEEDDAAAFKSLKAVEELL